MQQFLALIGGGNMGGAIYTALSSTLPTFDIFVCEPEIAKLVALGVPKDHQYKDSNLLMSDHDCDIVLFCIKPQSVDEFTSALQVDLSEKLIISIMAGVTISKLQQITESDRIVRSMPNLAAFVNESLTGWVATEAVSADDRDVVKSLFSSFGKEVELQSEDQINDITALSGSGPAYFFYLVQLMQEKAVEMGFSPTDALLIAQQTIFGAAEVLKTGIKSPEEWKAAVTSPGGTTEAALKHMEAEQFHHIFKNSIQKARERAEELA